MPSPSEPTPTERDRELAHEAAFAYATDQGWDGLPMLAEMLVPYFAQARAEEREASLTAARGWMRRLIHAENGGDVEEVIEEINAWISARGREGV